MVIEELLQLMQRLDRRHRVGKACSADGNRRSACEHHFDNIAAGTDAAHADDRHVDGLMHLIDHANSNREYSRAGQSTHDIGQDRAATFDINAHAEQRIDEGQRIRTCGDCRAGNFRDIRDIWGQLDNQRPRPSWAVCQRSVHHT